LINGTAPCAVFEGFDNRATDLDGAPLKKETAWQ